MAQSLLWADLSPEKLTELKELGSGSEYNACLASVMGVKEYESDPRGKVLMEMYVNNLSFAAEQGFSAAATSTFFSIMKSTFETSMDGLIAVDKSYAVFKAILLRHSVQRPPYSVGIFTLPELKAINDFVLNGFFRHYKMYRYVFTKEQRLTVGTSKWLGEMVEFAPLPPPLSQAEEQLAEQPVELAEDAVAEIVEKTGEDPLSVKEAFSAAVKEELKNLQGSLKEQEDDMKSKVAELEEKIAAAEAEKAEAERLAAEAEGGAE